MRVLLVLTEGGELGMRRYGKQGQEKRRTSR